MLYKINSAKKNQYSIKLKMPSCSEIKAYSFVGRLRNTRRNNHIHKYNYTYKRNFLKKQQIINKNKFLAPTGVIENLPTEVTIKHDV